MTDFEIERAVEVLDATDRGRQAMRDSLAMLDNGGIGLDAAGQQAMTTLILAAFTTHPGSARDAMRDALAESR